jgi:hypothetical protein
MTPLKKKLCKTMYQGDLPTQFMEISQKSLPFPSESQLTNQSMLGNVFTCSQNVNLNHLLQ